MTDVRETPPLVGRLKAETKRLVIDRSAAVLARLGGWFVVGALILMFGYLFSVAVPLLIPASATQVSVAPVPQGLTLSSVDSGLRAAMWTNETGQWSLRMLDTGDTIEEGRVASIPSGVVLQTHGEYLIQRGHDEVRLWKSRVDAHIEDDLSITFSGRMEDGPRLTDDDAAWIAGAGGEAVMRSDQSDWVLVVAGHELIRTWTWSDAASAPRTRSFEHQCASNNVRGVIGETLRRVSVVCLGSSEVDLLPIKGPQRVIKGKLTRPVQHVAGLSGGSSLVVSLAGGELARVQPAGSANVPVITTQYGNIVGVSSVITERGRKIVAAAALDGLSLWSATTGERVLYLPSEVGDPIRFDDSGARLLVQRPDGLAVYEVDNHHPEVSIHSLVGAVWYDGYTEASYVWQSSAGHASYEPKYSFVPLIAGTLKAALYALFLAVPLALFAALYTAEYLSSRARAVIKPAIEMAEALPTVILGLIGGIVLSPLVEDHLLTVGLLLFGMPIVLIVLTLFLVAAPWKWRQFTEGREAMLVVPVLLSALVLLIMFGRSLEETAIGMSTVQWMLDELGLTYDQRNAVVLGLILGFAVTPVIFSIAEDAFFAVPRRLVQASLAIGASHWQTLWRVVALSAAPGLFAACMVGLGRAVGETMIVLMASGNTPLLDFSPFSGLRTFSANLAVEMPESEVGSTHYRLLFLSATLLLTLTFIINLVAEHLRVRLRRRYGGGA